MLLALQVGQNWDSATSFALPTCSIPRGCFDNASIKRYDSMWRTHFGPWLNVPVLNHTPARADVLHRHYVALDAEDARKPLTLVQERLVALMRAA